MYHWYALETNWQEEARAFSNFEKQRITALLPMQRMEYRRKKDGLLCSKIIPLFSGYMFVKCDWKRHSSKVAGTKGVKSFVGYREDMDEALPVRKKEIEDLRQRLIQYKGWDVLDASRPLTKLELGELVRALFGPFRELVAPVTAINSRVEVTYQILGKPVVVPYEEQELRAVA